MINKISDRILSFQIKRAIQAEDTLHAAQKEIEHGIGGKWKVRALKYLPVTTPRKEST